MRFSATETVRLSGVGAALAPLLLIGASHVLHIGGAPGAAIASDAGGALVGATVAAQAALTEPQRAALEFVSTVDLAATASSSPFYIAPPTAPTPPPTAALSGDTDQEPPAAEAEPLPELRVSSIVSGGPHELAMIDGRAHVVGDEVAPGWVLHAIHAPQRSITLRHRDGRTVRVEINLR